ncbi:MAG: hypothetical protein SCARUB_05277 [Candidatus Scalindua rubra]|uniref:Uncharacterized protein n=1 Tax=Candidatus Scalindua rubra TaxID=1872076 RepID=A0A1E3X1Z6_9BACT|nr:MAG: hypothetical protein SCARUB_05277 [Candidatus Scalindua rubra]
MTLFTCIHSTLLCIIIVFASVDIFCSQWSSGPSENKYVREVGFPQQLVLNGRVDIIIGFQANSLMTIRVDSAGLQLAPEGDR